MEPPKVLKPWELLSQRCLDVWSEGILAFGHQISKNGQVDKCPAYSWGSTPWRSAQWMDILNRLNISCGYKIILMSIWSSFEVLWTYPIVYMTTLKKHFIFNIHTIYNVYKYNRIQHMCRYSKFLLNILLISPSLQFMAFKYQHLDPHPRAELVNLCAHNVHRWRPEDLHGFFGGQWHQEPIQEGAKSSSKTSRRLFWPTSGTSPVFLYWYTYIIVYIYI